MENQEYLFRIGEIDVNAILNQVTQALEKRTELVSREKHPALWRHTDKLKGHPNAPESTLKKRRIFTRTFGIINLLLGMFLLIPGLVDPKGLLIPLLVGAVATGAGIGGLWRSRKNKKNPFAKSAKRLLDKREQAGAAHTEMFFLENEMQLQPPHAGSVSVPYSDFEYVIETTDIFLLTYQDCATVLQKRDLVTNNLADFCEFISSKVKLIRQSVV